MTHPAPDSRGGAESNRGGAESNRRGAENTRRAIFAVTVIAAPLLLLAGTA